ncbi:MAG: BrnT family toxin [Pseudomonadota bacterium]
MEWDERKRLSNLAKHGLDFRAFERFDWDKVHFLPSDIMDGEVRERALGLIDGQLVHVVFVDLNGGERLVSLRTASRAERNYWNEQN